MTLIALLSLYIEANSRLPATTVTGPSRQSPGVRSYETTSNNDVLDRPFTASIHFRAIAGYIHRYCSSQYWRSISVKINVVLLIWWFSFWQATRLRLVPVGYRGLLRTDDVCLILCLEHLQIDLFSVGWWLCKATDWTLLTSAARILA